MMLHHTSGKVTQVSASPTTKVTVSSARSPAVTVRGEFVIFCHLEKSSDKVITSSSSLFKF